MRLGRGFTLLELLLAVGLAALVLVVSYSFFSFVEKSGRAAVENGELQSLVSPLFYLFLKDFESINTSYGSPKVLKDVDGNLKWIEFFTENCYYFKGICRVRYWIYKSEGHSWLVRSEFRLNSTGRGIDFPLTSRVSGLSVFKLSGGSWVEGIGGKLIKVVLRLKEGGELPLVFKIRS